MWSYCLQFTICNWGCMEELYKKDLNEPEYYNGVVSYTESDILGCKVKGS